MTDVSHKIKTIQGIRNYACRFFFILLLLSVSNSRAQTKKNTRVKIACVGNSVTAGYSLADSATQSYPAILQQKLGPGYEVGNFGHSGATLLKNGHNPYYKTPEFARAIQMHADIVLIDLGLNDTDPRDYPSYRDNFMPDYNWLIDTFRQVNPKAKIIICKMTPIFTGHPRFLSSTFDWYHDLQGRIEQVAALHKVSCIDLYTNFHDRPDLITDLPTLHPNAAGARKLAQIIYKHITGDFGGLRLADIFTDNMILQRGKPIRIWGVADAGSSVDILFHGIHKMAAVPFDGHWTVELPAMEANSNPLELVIANQGKQIKLHNILIGDLWLCSGQSNMEFTTSQALGGDSLLAGLKGGASSLRLFQYKSLAETDNTSWDTAILQKTNELQFFSGSWQLPDKANVAPFSAIAYIFGKQIQEKENIPVGIIELAVGGSPLISWVDRLTLESHPAFEPALHDWIHSDYIMGWCRERAATNMKASKAPYQRHPYEPCYNYEAGVAKITQLPIRGVLWYQGESDADNAELFEKLFPVFVQSWRTAWKEELPFYYVQLSSIERPSWNYFRDVQRKLLQKVPHSKMIVTSDLGDPQNVHYTNKIPVGLRAARVALRDSYQEKLEESGPLFKSVEETGGIITLYFLHNRGLSTADNTPLRGFKLMDAWGNFHDAVASIKNNTIRITLPQNQVMTKVVYGWEPFTRANLVNSDGLPASTFMANL